MRLPEDLTPGGRSWVIIDQYRGAALAVIGSRAPSAVGGAVIFDRAVHTGDTSSMIAGPPTCLAMVLSGWYLYRAAGRAMAAATALA